MNYLDYKFRASSLPQLLYNEKAGKMPETAKSFFREQWIKATFNRERFVSTKYTKKGTMVESDSLTLVEKATGDKFFKNKLKFENEWTMGTPDVVEDSFILDIKSSWDLYTFAGVTEEKAYKDYFGQLMGYMALTGRKKALIAYCLVDTPESLIEKEIFTLMKTGVISESEEDQKRVWNSLIFEDIPEDLRVKIYDFDFDDAVEKLLIDRAQIGRDYMNTMTL